MAIRSVEELSDVRGVRVLVRCSFDVPVLNGVVTDGFRLEEALPTISFLSARGAKVILMGHTGRDPLNSMRPIFDYLRKKISISFVEDIAGIAAHKAAQELKDGEVLIVENLRRNAGETGNDTEFAKELASLGEIYVDDAFTNAHRKHASMVGVPQFLPSYAGIQFMKEIQGLTPALNPESPSLAIVGGAKFETKVTLLHTLLQKYDKVFAGGAIVNDLYVAKGYEIGKSKVSGDPSAAELIQNSKILLPEIITTSSPAGREDKKVTEVNKAEAIMDIAPASIEALRGVVEKSKMILWNGPMGNFENGFVEGTDALAKLVAEAPGKTIVGGGDTLASIQNLGLMEKFTFVSTAGGAMLDFLANGTLPGIEALEAKK